MYEEECDSRDEKEENVPETAGLTARWALTGVTS